MAHEFNTIMLWAASTVCFFGFFRIGEITTPSDASFSADLHLSFSDLAVDNPTAPSVVRIRLKSSKTDQFRRGVDVFIGSSLNELCPVAAMLAYLARRGGHPGALFHFEDGTLLTPDRFTARVRDALGHTGKSYAGHSFRIGAATTAAEKGLEDSLVKALGEMGE